MSFIKLFKKIFGLICLVAIAITLFSCDALQESQAILAKRQAKKDVDTVLSKLVWDVQDMEKITANLELTTVNKAYPNVTITWSSSEPDVISATGEVTRTAYDDERAVPVDGSTEETIVEVVDGKEVVTYKDKVVRVVLTATASTTYSYETTIQNADGTTSTKTIQEEIDPISKDFVFTVLTVPHGVEGGSIASVKAAAWKYVYEENKVEKKLVSNSNVVYDAMVTGVVTAKLNAAGATLGFMVHDGTAGIYVYGDNTGVSVGDTVQVIGGIYTYYGSLQFGSNISVTKLSEPLNVNLVYPTYTPAELEAAHAPLADGTYADDVIGEFGGKLVTIAGTVTARTAPAGSGKYCILDANDGTETTWIYYKSYTAEQEEILKSLDGKYIETKVVTYDRDSRLNKNEIMWTGVYEEKEAPEMSDEAKINAALGNITIESKYTEDFDLPAISVGTATWSIVSGEGAVIDGSKVKITQSGVVQEVVLSVTVVLNDASVTKQFTFKIPAIELVELRLVVEPHEGVEYFLALDQEQLKEREFITGAMSGYYYETTADRTAAAKVRVVAVDGGYNLVLVGETEQFLNIVASGKYINVKFEEAASSVWTFNTTLNTFVTVVNDVEYFLGNSKTYNTFSANKVEAADSCNVSHLFAEDEYAVISKFALEAEYFLTLHQDNLEKQLFLNGEMSGYYFATTEALAEAAKVKVVAVDGGYHLVLLGETNKFINIVASGTYINVKFEDAANSVWTYDAELNTFVTVVNDTTYFLGTSKTYNTLSANKVANAATSFVAHLAALTGVEEKQVEPEVKVYTVDEILALMAGYEDKQISTEQYTVSGVVFSSSYNSKYSSYTIWLANAAGEKAFELYSVGIDASVDLGDFDPTAADALKGATVTCTGYLQLYGTTYEMPFLRASALGTEADFTPLISKIVLPSTEPENPTEPEDPTGDTTEHTVDEILAIMKDYKDGDVSEVEYVVKGKVLSSSYNPSYQSYTMWLANAAGEKAFELYSVVIAEGVSLDGIADPSVADAFKGAVVTCKGLLKLYGTTYEMAFIRNVNTPEITAIDLTDLEEPAPEEPVDPSQKELPAVFQLGTDVTSDPKHKDGDAFSEYKETVNGYQLVLKSTDKCYSGGCDATGNGAIKIGTGSAVGGFSLEVPDEVNFVIIMVAAYKANTAHVQVNGGEDIEISGETYSSNNGSYLAIKIDTSTTKTITFTTLSNGKRCMIDSIGFYASDPE